MVLSLIATEGESSRTLLWKTEVTVDLGEDRGQNLGTLFETRDADKEVTVGAGFLGAYNTLARNERRLIHFFVRRRSPETKESMVRLPRPTTDSGVYLFNLGEQLFETSAAEGKDPLVRKWDPGMRGWKPAPETNATSTSIGNGLLHADRTSVRFNDHTILELEPGEGGLDKPYYGDGMLVFRLSYPMETGRVARLVACPWRPGGDNKIDLANASILDLATPGEFVYAYGQQEGNVVVATNTGGVYQLKNGKWSTVRAPSPGVSFQIYAMINFGDRLLLGQYPTGRLFEYRDGKIWQLEDWPPCIEGVSRQAREAQTLAIYNGELYVGVWPWGEIWKLDADAGKWKFVARAFSHPEPTDAEQHPYQRETTAVDPVINLWGQRVTSLVPLGGSLFVGTSAKSSRPFDAKFSFLSHAQWQEYGSVLEMTLPGQATGLLQWPSGPTTIAFEIHADHLAIRQDGKLLGKSSHDGRDLPCDKFEEPQVGRGVFGRLSGRILKSE